ncbi:hypothetical protein CBS101457_002551 [Exobasidium rhododendri]|nr:hypothetical protein CBS101457_002551 [Exobasidium rhododendri]
MVQRRQRPASASVSTSTRPRSLFWTEYEPENSGKGVGKERQLTKSKSSYGATDTYKNTEGEGDPTDPYGYRFLAGPSLLPSFHEEQQNKQKLREAKSRTCGPRIEAVRRKKWLILAIAGVAIVVGGLWYTFL